ncbi:hypothetical protein VTJ04DRAFT_3622 [Mycothermus thermophilus]|uniref:uncharacterized protein n=1 Tax=Humicola insolens TaxID=85995 RepID=UPI003743841B
MSKSDSLMSSVSTFDPSRYSSGSYFSLESSDFTSTSSLLSPLSVISPSLMVASKSSLGVELRFNLRLSTLRRRSSSWSSSRKLSSQQSFFFTKAQRSSYINNTARLISETPWKSLKNLNGEAVVVVAAIVAEVIVMEIAQGQTPPREGIFIDRSPELENDKAPVSRREKKIRMYFRAMEIEIQAINKAITNSKANLLDVRKAVKEPLADA